MIHKLAALLVATLIVVTSVPTFAYAQELNATSTTNTTTTETNTTVPVEPTQLPVLPEASNQNQNQNQNQTQAFQALENSTAILNQQLESEDTNQSDRAEIKRTISQGLSVLGDAADKVVNATSEQLRTVQTNAEAISEAVDQLFNGE